MDFKTNSSIALKAFLNYSRSSAGKAVCSLSLSFSNVLFLLPKIHMQDTLRESRLTHKGVESHLERFREDSDLPKFESLDKIGI